MIMGTTRHYFKINWEKIVVRSLSGFVFSNSKPSFIKSGLHRRIGVGPDCVCVRVWVRSVVKGRPWVTLHAT